MPTDPSASDGAHLRPYRPSDLDAVYEICLRTGAAGEDATEHVDDHRLFGEVWAAPYVTVEPEHAHVVDDGTGRAIGYVLGTVDVVAFEAWCERAWWPPLRDRYRLVDGGTRLDDLLIALIHHRPEPDLAICEPYPSELHIDLLPEAQGRGWGRRLIDVIIESFRAAGSPGVHLGTSIRNTRAIAFYEHLGFERLTPVGSTAASIDFALALSDPGDPT